MNERILFVDDEKGLLDMLKLHFHKNGYHNLYFATSGSEALDMIQDHHFDLLILDIMLPDMDGFTICNRIREKTVIPILFLTARTSEADLITGLTLGGDDYVTKPFNPLELLARVKAILRRKSYYENPHNTSNQSKEMYDFDCFQLNRTEAKLIVNNVEVNCPAKEFELLAFFCQHVNHVFSVEQLYKKVWGEESIGSENTVMVHIRRLREKIEKNPSNPKHIITVRGFGYKFVG